MTYVLYRGYNTGPYQQIDEWNYLHSNHCSFTLCPAAKWLGFPHSLFKCCCTYQCFIGTSLHIMLIDIHGLVHVCGNLNYFDCYQNGFCGAKHYFEKVILSNMPWVSCRKTTLLVCTLALKAQPHMFFLSIFEKIYSTILLTCHKIGSFLIVVTVTLTKVIWQCDCYGKEIQL